MVRLFIAVEVEDPNTLRNIISIRDRVASCTSEVDLKPVEDENIHITLRFIGEVAESSVKDIIKSLEGVRHVRRFHISVRGLGAFPSMSRPRVIWLGISEGAQQLKLIRDIIEDNLRKLGIRAEREEFVPHITLARIKSLRGGGSKCLSDLFLGLGNVEVGTSPVSLIKLKRSTLTPRGPIYNDVFEVKLAD